jgi:microcystin-dependent protein
MPDTTTPNFGLVQPEVGASRDTWGTKWNQNATILDQFLSYAMPIGAIIDFAGPQAPPGWLICDGRLISRVTYSQLFAVISTYWGAGDGTTTFALPPTPGRASIGPGQVIDELGNSLTFSFTQTKGLLNQGLTRANLPNVNLLTDVQGYHNHTGATAPGGSHTHSTDTQGGHYHAGAYLADPARSGATDGQGQHQHNAPTSYQYNASSGAQFPIYAGAPGFNGYTTDAAGNHAHNVAVNSAGNLGLSIPTDGWHGHNLSVLGNFQLGIYPDGSHQHNVSLGGSAALFEVLSPVMVVTKIIYAGGQAAPGVLALMAPQAMRQRLAAPLRGMH